MHKAFRDAYRAREFTASRAADKLQISEATVESLLNGSSWPDLPTIARIERNLRPQVLGQPTIRQAAQLASAARAQLRPPPPPKKNTLLWVCPQAQSGRVEAGWACEGVGGWRVQDRFVAGIQRPPPERRL